MWCGRMTFGFNHLVSRYRLYSVISNPGASAVRVCGIVAHIDAGKTTTTERLLYKSGKIQHTGDVDDGDTVMDFLPEERERGITIQSASISLNWQPNVKINLIDTPGHADFNYEVIKTLKVMDGAITILDAVAGVESQTIKNWNLALNLPKICFINKMDRLGSNFSTTVKEIITKLHTRVALINIPYVKIDSNKDEKFCGVIDIINAKCIDWSSDPDSPTISGIDGKSLMLDTYMKCKESLVETLCEFDDQFMNYYIDEIDGDMNKISTDQLNKVIRKLTINKAITPVLCGSSLTNIGIEPLLDAIVNYLPSPIEAPLPKFNQENIPVKYDNNKGLIINNNNNLCLAHAFKVITDPIRGLMVFIRIYSGILRSGNIVFNTTTGEKIKLGKLLIMDANKPYETQLLRCGDIGVITGSTISNKISTDNTIISHCIKKDGIKLFKKDSELNLVINPMITPSPVFTMSVQPNSLGNAKYIDSCLERLVMEDPSLHIDYDEETGQKLLAGLGELHLQIAKNKLLNEMKADVELGEISVSMKETLGNVSILSRYKDEEYCFAVQIEPIIELPTRVSKKRNTYVGNELWIPLDNDSNFLILEINDLLNLKENWSHPMKFDTLINALRSSGLAGLHKGGKKYNYPLYSCLVRIKEDWCIPTDVAKPTKLLTIIRNLILDCLKQTKREEYIVLEPIMKLTINTNGNDVGKIIQDLTKFENAIVESIDDVTDSDQDMNNSIEFVEVAEKQYLPPQYNGLNSNEWRNNDINKTNIADQLSHNSIKIVKADVPLKNMIAYNNQLRSLSQGRADFSMQFHRMGISRDN